MMAIEFHLISGMMLGIEFISEMEECNALVIDLFVVRTMIFW
jgi:hypothetical protein